MWAPGGGRRGPFPSRDPSGAHGWRSRGQRLGGGGLELIRELMAAARAPAVPAVPSPSLPPVPPPAPSPSGPGQGRRPPAAARSAAIHHLDPWRALTAAPAALTRLTKQFATSHLLDRLLARLPLKEPSPVPGPARGSYLLSPLPPTSYCPSARTDVPARSRPSPTTPECPPTHTTHPLSGPACSFSLSGLATCWGTPPSYQLLPPACSWPLPTTVHTLTEASLTSHSQRAPSTLRQPHLLHPAPCHQGSEKPASGEGVLLLGL